MALMYDLLILLALSMAYSALATAVMVATKVGNAGDYETMHDGLGFQLGWLASIVGFYWFFWSRAGQTVGMKAWRLKIVDAQGNTPSHAQCWIRMVVSPIALALGGLGYWWCLINRKHAAWPDIASGTQVVTMPKLDKVKAR